MAVRVLRALLLGSIAGIAASSGAASTESRISRAEEPLIDHQPVECSTPRKNSRVCAYVLDDGEVKRVRVFFRAARQEAYYWSDMVFDGIQFCATLPVARERVRAIDYYIWAVDDTFESSRTRDYDISLVPTSPCAYPVVDEDEARTSQLVVHATSDKQGDEIKEFEADGIVQFVPAKKP